MNSPASLEVKLEAFMAMVQRSQNTVIEAATSTMTIVEGINGRVLAINTLVPVLLLHIAELEGRLEGSASHSDDVGAKARSLLVEACELNRQSTTINRSESLIAGFDKFMERAEAIVGQQHLKRKLVARMD